MKLALISPKGPLYRHRGGIWKKSLRYQPLTLTTLAALIPKDVPCDVRLIDEGIADVPLDLQPLIDQVYENGRYSEEIDLIQLQPGPIGKTVDAIRSALNWLGPCKREPASHKRRAFHFLEVVAT